MMSNIILILLIVVFNSSCNTVQDATCIKEANKGVEIRWGEANMETKEMLGYALNTKSELLSTSTVPGYSEFDYDKIGDIPQDIYCEMFKKIRKEFLKTQTLNSPGPKISRYVEYYDRHTNVKLRVLWNPEHKTYWSEGFRGIYDQLQKLVEIAE